MKFASQGNTTTGVALHSSIIQLGRLEQCEYSFLLKETTTNNIRQLGIEPGSFGLQVEPKPLLLL